MTEDPVERLKINLKPQSESDLNNWITNQRNSISRDRIDFISRHRTYLYNYDDFITFTRKGDWHSFSNVHMPLTFIVLKSFVSQLFNIFSQADAVNFVPTEMMDEKTASLLKKLRNWYMFSYINEFKGIGGVLYEICHDTCAVGYSVALKRWFKKQRKIIDLEEAVREAADMEPQIAEGNNISVKPYREVEKILTVFEGTSIQTVPMENVWFPNDIPESTDLNHPPCVLVSTRLSTDEVNRLAKEGVFDKENAKKAVEHPQNQQVYSLGNERDIRDTRDRLTGYDSTASSYDSRMIDVEYAFCRYDIDDDGFDEEIIVTRTPDGLILRIDYLDRICKYGDRPLFKFDCFVKPRQAYSRGVPELVYSLNEELDMNHNMRLDYLSLQAMPTGVYRGGSSTDSKPIRMAPGKFFPVDDTNDIKPFSWPVSAQVLAPEEDRIMRTAELVTNVSPQSQGVVPGNVGPLRSTSGVVTLLAEAQKNFRPMVAKFAESIKKMEMSCLEDLDFRVPDAMKLRILGAQVDDEKSYAQLSTKMQKTKLSRLFDVSIDVAGISTSEEMQRNDAQIILQMVSAPSVAQQTGVIGPKAIYRAWANWLKRYNQDPNLYIDEPEMTSKAMTLWQEIQVIAQGMMPPMAMADDHGAKAQQLVAFMQTPEFLEAKQKGLYVSDAEYWFQKAAEKHQMIMQQTQPQGMPNPSGNANANMNQMMSGTAPQQGGQSPTKTTSRDEPEEAPVEQ